MLFILVFMLYNNVNFTLLYKYKNIICIVSTMNVADVVYEMENGRIFWFYGTWQRKDDVLH